MSSHKNMDKPPWSGQQAPFPPRQLLSWTHEVPTCCINSAASSSPFPTPGFFRTTPGPALGVAVVLCVAMGLCGAERSRVVFFFFKRRNFKTKKNPPDNKRRLWPTALHSYAVRRPTRESPACKTAPHVCPKWFFILAAHSSTNFSHDLSCWE